MVQEGKVTDQGIGELRSRMPYADLSAFDRDRRVSAVSDLFTVGLVVGYIAWKLERTAGDDAKRVRNVPDANLTSPRTQAFALATANVEDHADVH